MKMGNGMDGAKRWEGRIVSTLAPAVIEPTPLYPILDPLGAGGNGADSGTEHTGRLVRPTCAFVFSFDM